jgi:hypothetical protein
MGYRSTYAGCRVRVDGESRFVVRACVEYDGRLTPKERARLAPSAQMKVILAVLGEAERGRQFGAGTVRVAVSGDPALERFFRAWSGSAAALERPEGKAAARALPSRGVEAHL